MPGLPRRGLFLLSRATDEPQMDGQLLWVSEPREVGVTRGSVCMFWGVGMQVKGAPLREGVDSRRYFHIHAPFVPTVPLAILPGGLSIVSQKGSQGALDHWTLISEVKGSICHFRPPPRSPSRGVIKRPPDILPGPGSRPSTSNTHTHHQTVALPDSLASWWATHVNKHLKAKYIEAETKVILPNLCYINRKYPYSCCKALKVSSFFFFPGRWLGWHYSIQTEPHVNPSLINLDDCPQLAGSLAY